MPFQRVFSLLGFVLLLLSSCKYDYPSLQRPSASPLSVQGVRDIEAIRGGSTHVWLRVSGGAANDTVTLSVEGLAHSMSASLDPTVGTGSFSSNLRISPLSSAGFGELFKARLVAKCSNGDTAAYPFEVTVVPRDCADEMEGDYRITWNCGGGSMADSVTEVEVIRGISRANIRFAVPAMSGTHFYVLLDCSSYTVVLNPQYAAGFTDTVEGGGTFTDSTVSLMYTIKPSGGNPRSCQATLTRL